ncbi:MAG: hypothetical protein ABI658_26875 [Acidimicrobiales bacterium]
MDDIDAMVVTLTAALSEMMTDDGPVPGSVLETMMGAGEPFDKAAEMLVFASQRLGVSIAVADMVVGRLTDFVEFAGDVIYADPIE